MAGYMSSIAVGFYRLMKWLGVVIAPIAIIVTVSTYWVSRPRLAIQFDNSFTHIQADESKVGKRSDYLVTSFVVSNMGNWGVSIVSVELTASVNGGWVGAVDETRRILGDKALMIPMHFVGGEARRVSIVWRMHGFGEGTRLEKKWASIIDRGIPLKIEIVDSKGNHFIKEYLPPAIAMEIPEAQFGEWWAQGCPQYPRQEPIIPKGKCPKTNGISQGNWQQ